MISGTVSEYALIAFNILHNNTANIINVYSAGRAIGNKAIVTGSNLQTNILNALNILQSSTSPSIGSWVQGDLVLKSNPSIGYPLGWACTVAGTPGTWVTFGQVGYRSRTSSPIGSLAPVFIGEELLDTAVPRWYKSTGLTNSDWVALN